MIKYFKNKIYIEKLFLIVSILSFVGMFISYTLYSSFGAPRRYFYVFVILFLCFTGLYNWFNISRKGCCFGIQSILTFAVFGITGVAFTITSRSQYDDDSILYFIVITVIPIFFMLLSILNLIVVFKSYSFVGIICKIVEYFHKNWHIIVVIVMLGAGCFILNTNQPRWDATLLMADFNRIRVYDIFDVLKMRVYTHNAQAYGIINIVFGSIFDSLIDGMHYANNILYLISVYAVYALFKKLFPQFGNLFIIILTLVYALNPFVFGMSGYLSYDHWMIFLMPIVIYSLFTKQWIYHFVFTFIMCFTKETGIVSYFGLCFGYTIVLAINNKNNLVLIFKHLEIYIMAIVGVLWVCVYKNNSTINGFVDKFLGIDWNNYLQNLKIFFVLNFNWILFIFVILGLIILIVKNKHDLDLWIPIVCSEIFLLAFYLFFNTLTHARYVDGHVGCLIILAIMGVAYLIEINKKTLTLAIALVVLLMISNFSTIDPLSLKVFDTVDVGETSLVNTLKTEIFTDAVVYNMQYTFMDRALNKALKEPVEKGATIVFPRRKDWYGWSFDGQNGIFDVADEHWSFSKNKRVYFSRESDVDFTVYCVSAWKELPTNNGDNETYVFSIPCIGDELIKELYDKNVVAEKVEFKYMGFVITRIKLA